MRELPIIDDKRLLNALDYIDERFIAEVTEEYEIFDTAPGAKLPPRARMYRFRQFAAATACLLLLSIASVFVANAPQIYSYFTDAGGTPIPDIDYSDRDLIEHIGEVPEEFVEIVNQNLFKGIYVSGDKIIKASADEKYDIEVYDLYGNLLHKINYKFKPKDGTDFFVGRVRVHALSDGNYLMVIPYNTYYVIPEPGESVECEVKARAIKFNEKGRAIFDTPLLTKCGEFEFFFEVDDGYLLIGGSYQKMDRYFLKLDESGNLVHNLKFGGLEHDRLYYAEYGEDGLTMYLRDYASSGYDILRQRYSDDYVLLESETYEGDIPYPEFRLMPSGSWRVDDFVSGYNGKEIGELGDVISCIKYNDFVLIVSERDTYEAENIHFLHMYTETVYTAYTYDAEIIWRSAVDSTDYEKLAQVKEKYDNRNK